MIYSDIYMVSDDLAIDEFQQSAPDFGVEWKVL